MWDVRGGGRGMVVPVRADIPRALARGPSYSHYFGGFSALPRAQLWSHRRFIYGGYYPMLNSIVSVTSVRDPDWGLYARRQSLLTAITSVGFWRSPERSSGPTVACYGGYYPMLNSIDVGASVRL